MQRLEQETKQKGWTACCDCCCFFLFVSFHTLLHCIHYNWTLTMDSSVSTFTLRICCCTHLKTKFTSRGSNRPDTVYWVVYGILCQSRSTT